MTDQELGGLIQKIMDNKYNYNYKEIETILFKFKLSEIEFLKIISLKIKITTQNVDHIYQKFNGFEMLQESCVFYKEIVDDSSIKQQNFLNIHILNYLLTHLDSSNIAMFAIYSNLFLVDIDITSFYQIIFTHCLGCPHSIYEISLFLKEYNTFHDNCKLIKDIVFKYRKRYQGQWEISTLEYFLKYFNIIEDENQPKANVQPKLERFQKEKTKTFELIKSKEVFNPLYKSIINDDIDEFSNLYRKFNMNTDDFISNSVKTGYYWPFDKNKMNLIDLSAFFCSIKIFKYLFLNHADLTLDSIDYAIAGGNTEIIRLCIQKGCKISLKSFEMSIRYYRNDILSWLIENNRSIFMKGINDIACYSIYYSNTEAFLIILENTNSFQYGRMDSFTSYEKEWLKLIVTVEPVYSDIIKEIDSIYFNRPRFGGNFILKHPKYLVGPLLCSIEYFLREKGILDQYKDTLLIPPFPNKLVINYIRRFSGNTRLLLYGFFSIEFIIFIIKKRPISFINNKKELCMKAIEMHDMNFIRELRKYYPKVIGLVLRRLTEYKGMMSDDSYYYNYCNHKSYKKYLLDNKKFIDKVSNHSVLSKLLKSACLTNNKPMMEYLFQFQHVDVNLFLPFNQKGPHNHLVERQSLPIIKFLLNDKRIDVNYTNEKHETLFCYACKHNYIEIVDWLLYDKRIDINIPDENGKMPFLIACKNGNYDIVKHILDKNHSILNVSYDENSPFVHAVKDRDIETIKLLIKNNGN